jgi:hypothetical protein
MSLTFATPLLLIGLVAAGVPVVLHLIASLRAPRVPWPTLRFLQASLQRTSRRRSIQRWLLLLLRALGMGLLAIALAEPILQSRQSKARFSRNAAVAIVIDNSLSMGASADEQGISRFELARQMLIDYLNGDDRPGLATVVFTNDTTSTGDMTDQLGLLRQQLIDARIAPGQASLAHALTQAARRLDIATGRQKILCLITDLQAVSTDGLADLALPGQEDMSLIIIDLGRDDTGNVGIADLQLTGQAVAGNTLEVTATLVNSAPVATAVDVALYVDGQAVGLPQQLSVGPAGQEDARQEVAFPMPLLRDTLHVGQVVVETRDVLAVDNVRYFAVEPAGDVQALIVHGTDGSAAMDQPGVRLSMVLNPFDADAAGPIRPRSIPSDQFAAADLREVDVAFFCEVPRFTPSQAAAVEAFIRAGHMAVILLGDVDTLNYNEQLGAWLPVVVGQAVPSAPAARADEYAVDHPLLMGMYAPGRPWPEIRIDRHVTLRRTPDPSRTLVATTTGDPIVVVGPVGEGQVIISALPDRPNWSNAMTTHVLPAMFIRAALMAGANEATNMTFTTGPSIRLAPASVQALSEEERREALIKIRLPNATDTVDLPIRRIGDRWGAVFEDPRQIGVYEWQCVGPNVGSWRGVIEGRFVVNTEGAEADLTRADDNVLAALVDANFADVIIAPSLAEARQQIATLQAGTNMWDVLAAVVIVVLLVEMFVANRNGLSAWQTGE